MKDNWTIKVTDPMGTREMTQTQWMEFGAIAAERNVEIAKWIDPNLPEPAIRIEFIEPSRGELI